MNFFFLFETCVKIDSTIIPLRQFVSEFAMQKFLLAHWDNMKFTEFPLVLEERVSCYMLPSILKQCAD